MTDLRHVLRALQRAPGFVLTAALTLSIGIGAAVTVFALVEGVLFRPLSTFEPERVVRLAAIKRGDEQTARNNLSWVDRRELATDSRTLRAVALSGLTSLKIAAGEATAGLVGETVSGTYFELLHVPAGHGRVLTPADDVSGAPPVAVISPRLQARIFPDRDPLGQTVTLNRQPFTVVGVAPQDFSGTFIGAPVDVWIPTEAADPFLGREWRTRPSFSMIGRLASRATREQLQAELDVLWPPLARGNASRADTRLVALDGDRLGGRRRSAAVMFALVLAVLVALVLAIVCANVANLLLARGLGLRRQMAIRLALGARRRRIVGLVMAESVIVAALGGAGALALASVLVPALSTFNPLPTLSIELGLRVDRGVALAAGVLALLSGVVLGFVPALHASRPEMQASLREESGTVAGGRHAARLRSALVIAQVAVSLLLLGAAGLFGQSLANARRLELGFNPDGAVAVDLDIDAKDVVAGEAHRLFARLEARLRERPDVEAVAFSNRAPVDTSTPLVDVLIDGTTPAPGASPPKATMYLASPDYFQVVAIPIVTGRAFRDSDTLDSSRVAIVNETMARRFWARDAIGRRFQTSAGGPRIEVIGIARDSRYRTPGEEPSAHVYLPFAQSEGQSATVLVRARGDARTLLPMVERAIDDVQLLEGSFPRTLRDHLSIYVLPSELAAALSAALGTVAMLVGAIGLYGLIAYAVTQRTREIALRIALGASAADIRRDVLGGAARLAVPGAALGLIGTLGVGRLASGFVYGVGVVDVRSLVAATLLLALVVFTASYLPARRAMRIDPAVALRR